MSYSLHVIYDAKNRCVYPLITVSRILGPVLALYHRLNLLSKITGATQKPLDSDDYKTASISILPYQMHLAKTQKIGL
jgi:hypothetical protein